MASVPVSCVLLEWCVEASSNTLRLSDTMSKLRDERIDDLIPDTILFLEHPEIVTMGPRARREGVTAEGLLNR